MVRAECQKVGQASVLMRIVSGSGFAISSVTAPDVPTTAQTCVMTATSASFITVQCDTGAFAEFSDVTVPNTVSNKVLSSYVLFAPLYQLNFKESDLPVKTTSQSPTPSSSPASSRPTTSLPSQTSGSPTATSSPTTGSGSASPSATPPPGVDPSGGLATGAKIGIGVGVALGALLLIALAVILRGRRKRKERAAAPIGAGQDRKEKGPQAELAGEEVRELDGRPVVSELPTRLPSGRVPPRKTGPNIRRSDQGWVVSPIEPHGDAVFELEGDSTPTSTFESRGR